MNITDHYPFQLCGFRDISDFLFINVTGNKKRACRKKRRAEILELLDESIIARIVTAVAGFSFQSPE